MYMKVSWCLLVCPSYYIFINHCIVQDVAYAFFFPTENTTEMQGTHTCSLTHTIILYPTRIAISLQRGPKVCGNPCPICRNDIQISYQVILHVNSVSVYSVVSSHYRTRSCWSSLSLLTLGIYWRHPRPVCVV